MGRSQDGMPRGDQQFRSRTDIQSSTRRVAEEHVRLDALAIELDEHLKEVHLSEVAGDVVQGDRDLPPLPLPLPDHAPGCTLGDLGPLLADQPDNTGRGQLLLLRDALRRLLEQLDDRGLAFSRSGRGRGPPSLRFGAGSSRYFETVFRPTPRSIAVWR